MKGIYTHIPETNYVPREYGVAAILLLLFMVLVSLVSVLNLLYFYIIIIIIIIIFIPLALQPTVGFGLSNNVLPFFPICHQLSPPSHSQHLKISFYFLFPSFAGSSPSSRPFQFLKHYTIAYRIPPHPDTRTTSSRFK